MNSLITGNTKFYSQTQNREYIEILRKNRPFTPEEEIEAFKKLKSGDKTILNEIVARNQRWVYSVAKEFARDEIEVMDYVQEGNIGLLIAIDKYDVDRGLKFITYAVWYMRRQMNIYMNTQRDMIKKSNNAKLNKKLEKIKNEFFVKNGYKISFDELKDILERTYDIIVNDERDLYDMEISSINETVNDDIILEECEEFTQLTATENEGIKNEDREYFRELVMPILEFLPEKQRNFIKELYNIDTKHEYTFLEIANHFDFDEETMKKMQNKILAYMRQELNEKCKNVV